MHDTDKPNLSLDAVPTEPSLQETQIAFRHPEGFEPIAYLIVAIDKTGTPFTNAPEIPALTLRLATIGLDYASQRAILSMQEMQQKKSAIIQAQSMPRFPGPIGRA